MKNKIVLIVGGSGGIGSETAMAIGKEGAKVVLAARNKAKAEEIAKQINDSGGDAYAIHVNATDEESVQKMAQEIEDNLGKIDVLVNAFGQGLIQPFLEIKASDAKEGN